MFQFCGGETGWRRARIAERKERDARVCLNLNFEFRRDAATAWPPGNSRGLRRVLVSRRMQFSVLASFNFSTGSAGDGSHGIRRRKTRHVCTDVHVCICTYTCMRIYAAGVTATPFPNCKLRITPVKVHRQVAIFELFTRERGVCSIYRRLCEIIMMDF